VRICNRAVECLLVCSSREHLNLIDWRGRFYPILYPPHPSQSTPSQSTPVHCYPDETNPIQSNPIQSKPNQSDRIPLRCMHKILPYSYSSHQRRLGVSTSTLTKPTTRSDAIPDPCGIRVRQSYCTFPSEPPYPSIVLDRSPPTLRLSPLYSSLQNWVHIAAHTRVPSASPCSDPDPNPNPNPAPNPVLRPHPHPHPTPTRPNPLALPC
jgi:hypothetical protein